MKRPLVAVKIRPYHFFVAIFVGGVIAMTYGWINDNAGLRPGNGAESELARQLAKGSISLTLFLIYGSIAFYACYLWDKFRAKGSSEENTET